MGIDRVDSAEDYDTVNCRPCCVVCNYMKSSVSLPHFVSKVVEIRNFTSQWLLPLHQEATLVACRTIAPVQVLRANAVVAQFPSRSRAASLVGVTLTTVSNNIGKHFRGGVWQDLDLQTYIHREPLEAAVVVRFLRQACVPHAAGPDQQQPTTRRVRGGGRVSVTCADGTCQEFVSQTAAARYLGCSQAAVSKAPSPWQYKTFTVSRL